MRISLLVLLLSVLACSSCKVKSYYGDSQPVSHGLWNELMKAHVNDQGWLDYQGIQKDKDILEDYLRILENSHPNPQTWSEKERLAYWINAYNAYTVKLVLDHYPVNSIKDIKKGIAFINSVWDIEFINIEGQQYSLTNIEHGILRPKFDEPRIHFAINCASYSCPVLRNEAFVAERLDEQLADAAKQFLNDYRRNRISSESPQLSKIFSWFKGDFTKEGSLISFINEHSGSQRIDADAKIEFLDYDWRLNDSSTQK